MRLRRCAAAIACFVTPLVAGCFQSSTLVKLNPDGSGTIEQTMTMSAEALSQLQSFSAMNDKDSKGKKEEVFSIEDARSSASKLGEGVTLVSADKIDTPDKKGMKAVYAFTDVRKLALTEMSAPGGSGFTPKNAQPMPLTFTQQPNGHSVLTIKNNTDVTKNLTPGSSDTGQPPLGKMDDPKAMEMMKAMLGGMKIDFAIQVGHVVRTNVPYVSGGTVTVLSLDFDQMLANQAGFEKLQKAKSIPETKAALRDVKGIKLSLDPELTIEFTK